MLRHRTQGMQHRRDTGNFTLSAQKRCVEKAHLEGFVAGEEVVMQLGASSIERLKAIPSSFSYCSPCPG